MTRFNRGTATRTYTYTAGTNRFSHSTERWNSYDGPAGLVAIHEGPEGTVWFPLKDNLGSTRVMLKTEPAGGGSRTVRPASVTDHLPFGGPMRVYGAGAGRFGFTGQEYDAETDLYNYKARLYSTDTGQFLSPDPAGQFHSPYVGMGNNLVNYVDPDGEWAFLVPIIVGAASGAGISAAMYTSTSLMKGNFSLESMGRAMAIGALGGAISGGFSAAATGLGAFGQSSAYGILSQTSSYASTTMASGGELSAGGFVASLVGGSMSGAIPGFSPTTDSRWGSAIEEIGFGMAKGANIGAMTGAVSAAIDGRNIARGIASGMTDGIVAGGTLTGLKIAAFGHAVRPSPSMHLFHGAASELEADMQLVGKGLGHFNPVFRSGGIWATLGGRPVALGNNLIVHTKGFSDTDDVYFEELFHYYQQVHMGYAGFLGQGLYEQMRYMTSSGRWNPYTTPGTIEWGAYLGRKAYGTF